MIRNFVVGFVGAVMLALAVMAAYELTRDMPPLSEVESVETRDNNLSQSNEIATNSVVTTSQTENAVKDTVNNGAVVPLDNGTVRIGANVKLRHLPSSDIDLQAEEAPLKLAKAIEKAKAEKAKSEAATPSRLAASVISSATPSGQSSTTYADTKPPMPNVPPVNVKSSKPVLPKPYVATTSKKTTKPRTKNTNKPANELVVMVTNAPKEKTAQQNVINRVRLEVGPTRVALRFIGAKPLKAKFFELNNPERFVLDLQGNWALELPRVPKNTLLSKLRIGRPKNITRIVLDLKRNPRQAEVVQINAKTLEVRLR